MHSGPVIAVVGGGVIGMSIAWRLAQAGAVVTLFESGRVGDQASWAGAGMLAPGGEYQEKTLWSDLALDSLSLYPDFVEELVAESGISIDYRQCGAFDVAFSESEAEALRTRASRQDAIGIYSEQFPPSRIPGLRGGAMAAQYFPHDSVANPRDLMRALRIACARAGVEIREFQRVNRIPLDAGNDKPFDRTVIAAGAWSSQIDLELKGAHTSLPGAMPVRGHLIAFEESVGLCDAIVRHDRTYLLRRSPNTVVAGSSIENVGFDRTVDGSIAAEIALRAGHLIPQLASRSYTAWNGLRPASASGEPVMGRLADSSVWLAYGHYRNGILLAPATALRITRELLSSEVTSASLQTDSFSPVAHRQ